MMGWTEQSVINVKSFALFVSAHSFDWKLKKKDPLELWDIDVFSVMKYGLEIIGTRVCVMDFSGCN